MCCPLRHCHTWKPKHYMVSIVNWIIWREKMECTFRSTSTQNGLEQCQLAPLGAPAPELDWDSANLPYAWQKFKQHVKLMYPGPYSKKPKAKHGSYLLIWVGQHGTNTFKTWTLASGKEDKVKIYYTKLEQYIKSKANARFQRYKCNKRQQGESDTFEQYYAELKLKVSECNFCNVGTCREERILDRLVFGVKPEKLRRRLIEKGSDLTQSKAVDMCGTNELSQAIIEINGRRQRNCSGFRRL